MPAEGVEMILEGVPWLESDEPVTTEAALHREYAEKIDRPLRLLTLGRLTG